MKKKLIIILIVIIPVILGISIKLFIDYQKRQEELSHMVIELTEKTKTINYQDEIDLNSLIQKSDGGKLDIIGNVDTSKIGEYEIIYRLTNENGLTKEEKVMVSVEDREKPVITLKNDKITVNLNSQINLLDGVTAKDNYDGDLTGKIIVEGQVDTKKVGTYEVKYQVKDTSGNIDEKVRTYTVSEIYKLTLNKEYKYSNKKYLLSIEFKKNNKVEFGECVRDGGCFTTEGKYNVNGNVINVTYTYSWHLAREVDGEKINQKRTYLLTKDGIKEKGKNELYKLGK